ncbi:hypothetical protein BD779DRAFT_1561885 [Infundibulicybe gibba]|nr:hypothetical protein BD779DRAFT_1561885 [Infundibulicybe gibba]
MSLENKGKITALKLYLLVPLYLCLCSPAIHPHERMSGTFVGAAVRRHCRDQVSCCCPCSSLANAVSSWAVG